MARRSVVVALVAGAAVAAAVVVAGVVWPGLDAKRTAPSETSVWALQTGDGRHYARVNTAVDELDTVRGVADPSAIAQTDSGAYLFSQSFGRLTRIDDALPAELDDQALRASPATPSGTVEVAVSGDYVAYRTDSGTVFAGRLSGGAPTRLAAGAKGAPGFMAQAIAVDDAGTVYAYSASARTVLRYDIPSARVLGRDPVAGRRPPAGVQLTAAGGVWFLVDADAGHVWHRGGSRAAAVRLAGSVALGRATAGGSAAWIADETGLVRLPVDGSAPRRADGGGSRDLGDPARPVVFDGTVYAAWLGATAATLWRSDRGESSLAYGGKSLDGVRKPVFVASASNLILNETRSGWVWDAVRGRLLPSSQDWSLDDRTDPQSAPSEQQAPVVIDPRPPVAEPDAFGVRAGALVALPVLLNDHDPNLDVLSIDPASVGGLDPGFGTVSVTDNGQRLAVQVAPGATGTATLHYRDTDGTGADGGLYSAPTTVTLTVTPDTVNRAPQWCGVAGCLASWPQPEVAPGGTVSVPVLNGWVDPDGDPVMLLSVVDQTGLGSVAATPSGEVVYQHPDASATAAQIVELTVTVADTRGATATKDLTVRIQPRPHVTAESFAVIGSLSSRGVAVDVAPHVSGTEGRLSLTSVRVLDEAPADAAVASTGTSFDLTAQSAGIYRVAYTVTDGQTDATATARVTVLPADAPAQLTTAPVVAYVHPQQDVTLDVFTAVSNPTGRVLLLSDVVPRAAPGASLSVDVVGQGFLRLSGSTADGAPGPLGTVRYVVSDGTSDEGARVQGTATVYLLPPAPELAPIAVDDSVVVRVGAQVDIPVLDNDVAPSGSPIALDPSSIRSSTPRALAFASGRLLRYLAPDEPGQYRVQYSVYASGSPDLADTATVHVTVISDEANRAPRPQTLEGRVLSGQSTTIPFRSFGVDPDGDQVSLDRILAQPKSGTATISADGESIVYSSVPGFHGQVSFPYQVVDPFGAVGTAVVRIGVLDEQANPSPITFTDYVQLQVGADDSARVSPLANDIDPTGGTLTLTDVRPDVVTTLADGQPNPEHRRLAALLGRVTASEVTIRAGTTPGTMSFLYDVQSSTGNTARGLIVVKVVREAVPDYPVVTDTVLTAETRDRFPTGVDVVADKVAWTGGDAHDLTVSLWGDQPGVTVHGTRLSGPLPEHTRIIPFAVTGRSATGRTVTSYGFLHVPGTDDLVLALRSHTDARRVTEGSSVSWDMSALVSVPQGAALEVGGDVSVTGARPAARCERVSGTTVRYDAGDGAPWTDACIVPVRLAGQQAWTALSVPVAVTALTPQPELQAASLTVGPGQSLTYDLTTMTTWQGRADWADVVYSLQYAGSDFSIVQRGERLTITGADDAVPGVEDVAVVGITSHPGVAPARLILRVGAAPSGLPQGGTVVRSCSEADGSSCTIPVVGAPGEIDPLPRTPLQVVAVRTTGPCVGVSLAVASPSSVVASWTADAPGATCTASFSVRDAQGRVTSGDRDGTILFDLAGYPKAPAALVQAAYGDGTITLRVDPGDARLASPALTGFVVRWQGQVVATCTPDGTCPAISAPNGERRVYEAAAVNAVGESRTTAVTAAWAYLPPPAPGSITATPVVTGGLGAVGGVVALEVDGVDPAQTAYLQISSPQGDTVQVPVSDTTVSVPGYRVGSNVASVITVTPYSRFPLPPGLDGSLSGAARTVTANGVGAPADTTLHLTSTANADGRTATVTAQGSASVNGDGSTLRLGLVRDGDTCVVADTGSGTVSRTVTVAVGQAYTYRLCAESWLGGQSFGRSETTQTVTAFPSSRAPVGYTFQVAADPRVGQFAAQWLVTTPPTSTVDDPPPSAHVSFSGYPSAVMGADPGMTAWYEWNGWRSDAAPVKPGVGSAPYQVQASWSVATCRAGAPLALAQTSTGSLAAVSFDTSAAQYTDAAGAVLATPPDGTVPTGATTVRGLRVTVDWSSRAWGLHPATAVFSGSCDPNAP